MGMFDTIRATLSCPVCGSTAEREIQTKRGPCLLLNLEVGDTIEPFFHGDIGCASTGIATNVEERLPRTNVGRIPMRLSSTERLDRRDHTEQTA